MGQELKNKYYKLIEVEDGATLSLVDSIFTNIDTLLLTERGRDSNTELLDLISVLEFTEEKLFDVIKSDIESGVIRWNQ